LENRSVWSRFEIWGVTATILLAPLSYWLASTSPLYTDEIGWKLIQSHFVDDGFHSRTATLAPGCGPDLMTTPALLVPVRYLDSFLSSFLSTPRAIRDYGVLLFLIWLAVAWALLRRLFAPVANPRVVLGAIVGVATLGVMPLLLVLSRPEQVLLIGITVFLILACVEQPQSQLSLSSTHRDFARALAMTAGGAILTSCHPRAFLALPIAVLACFRVVERRILALGAAASIAAFAIVAFGDFNTRLACPGDEAVRTMFNAESITLAASNHALQPYTSHLIEMLRDYPGRFLYLVQFDFLNNYTSNMFPAYRYPLIGEAISLFLSEFVLLLVLAGITSFALAAIGCVRRREGMLALCAVGSSWLIVLASIIARTTRNNYEAELMEPLLILTSVLSLWIGRGDLKRTLGEARVVFLVRAFFAGLIVLSIASQIAFVVGYQPLSAGAWGQPGYIPNQLHSASIADYSALSNTISRAAARCGIRPSDNLKYLVLDEVTYFPFRRSKVPQLMTNIDPREWGKGISDLKGLLANKGSDGAVAGCHWLPAGLRSAALRTGEFCCIPKSRI
jgi:hypothetical protein